MYMVSGEDTRNNLRRVEHLFRSISVFKCEDHADLGITNAGDRITEFLSMTAVVNGICDA